MTRLVGWMLDVRASLAAFAPPASAAPILTCMFSLEERVTGIEPAFSAWEAIAEVLPWTSADRNGWSEPRRRRAWTAADGSGRFFLLDGCWMEVGCASRRGVACEVERGCRSGRFGARLTVGVSGQCDVVGADAGGVEHPLEGVFAEVVGDSNDDDGYIVPLGG